MESIYNAVGFSVVWFFIMSAVILTLIGICKIIQTLILTFYFIVWLNEMSDGESILSNKSKFFLIDYVLIFKKAFKMMFDYNKDTTITSTTAEVFSPPFFFK